MPLRLRSSGKLIGLWEVLGSGRNGTKKKKMVYLSKYIYIKKAKIEKKKKHIRLKAY